MIPNLKINYNVLKEPICRGKRKKIKLKLNTNICQISQHCLLCVFFRESWASYRPQTKFVAKQCFCTHVCHPKGVCLQGQGGLPTEGSAYGEGRIGQTSLPATRKVGCIHPTGMLFCFKEYGRHVDSEFPCLLLL